MRRHGVTDAYEQLKALTRGRPVTRDLLHEFIASAAIPAGDRKRLLALTPAGYIGRAADLARKI
jgi:adenylosuccinate lyase